MDVEAVTIEGVLPEVVMEVDGAAPEVAEVLVEVPKSPWMPRPKLTLTKQSAKDKKDKQAVIPVHASSRRNPPKEKTINLELEEEEIENNPMDD